MADPVDLWGGKTPAPGIPLDLVTISWCALVGVGILLAGVFAYDQWERFRRRRRSRSRRVRRDTP